MHVATPPTEHLALPRWTAESDAAALVVRDIDNWARSAALRDLIAAHGVDPSPLCGENGSERLDALVRFSDRWDTRRGLERDQAAPVAPSAAVADAVLAGAGSLGLAGRETPPARRYDAVVMTGGMVRAQLVKPRFVGELIDGGLVTDEVVFLGGFRPFSFDESELAAGLGMSSRDEFAALAEGLDRRFGPLGTPSMQGTADRSAAGWCELSWRKDDRRLSALAAPSSDPAVRRANTEDTFRFWAERRRPATGRVLIVTTPIYVPYQAAVAVDVLGREYGMVVDTVGTSAAASDLGALSQPFRAQHHLQELRSALGAMSRLRAHLTA